MTIITILIGLIILVIIYLLIVLYKNFYKNEITKEEIVNDINDQIELDSSKNILNENFKNTKNTNTNTLNTNKNLVLTIGISKKTPVGKATPDWDKVVNVEIKLFDDIVPLTTKNFRTIAKKGINGIKYNGSIFHRVIRNFMIQGGDILNNNGTGSISIYGNNFEDENFNIKHNKPGLLSMANSGPDTNGSQFFITTASTPHLDGKHVVFGEVVKGLESIRIIENVVTDSENNPYEKVEIIDIREV